MMMEFSISHREFGTSPHFKASFKALWSGRVASISLLVFFRAWPKESHCDPHMTSLFKKCISGRDKKEKCILRVFTPGLLSCFSHLPFQVCANQFLGIAGAIYFLKAFVHGRVCVFFP